MAFSKSRQDVLQKVNQCSEVAIQLSNTASEIKENVGKLKAHGNQCFNDIRELSQEYHGRIPYGLKRSVGDVEATWRRVEMSIDRFSEEVSNPEVRRITAKNSFSREDFQVLADHFTDYQLYMKYVKEDFHDFRARCQEAIQEFENLHDEVTRQGRQMRGEIRRGKLDWIKSIGKALLKCLGNFFLAVLTFGFGINHGMNFLDVFKDIFDAVDIRRQMKKLERVVESFESLSVRLDRLLTEEIMELTGSNARFDAQVMEASRAGETAMQRLQRLQRNEQRMAGMQMHYN